jgi:hypothetical protein
MYKQSKLALLLEVQLSTSKKREERLSMALQAQNLESICEWRLLSQLCPQDFKNQVRNEAQVAHVPVKEVCVLETIRNLFKLFKQMSKMAKQSRSVQLQYLLRTQEVNQQPSKIISAR